MYITKNPAIARIVEEAGVDRIFVDMEFIGKECRQGGLDTVQNHHTIEDVENIRSVIQTAELLVRVNPIHDALVDYPSSEAEIEAVIRAGADIVMLPFFKTITEIQRFLKIVNGRVKTCLLIETPESVSIIDEILEQNGIDMLHIGLNDLHLALGKKFMFELLVDGTVEKLCSRIKAKGIPYGFGGLASLSKGIIPGSMVLKEHVRLESSMVILSRSFCNADKISDLEEIRAIFNEGIAEIRKQEQEAIGVYQYFADNFRAIKDVINKINSGNQ